MKTLCWIAWCIVSLILFAGRANATEPAKSGEMQRAEEVKREAQDARRLVGLMLGCISDTGARAWVRTARPAEVVVEADSRRFGPVASTDASDLTAVVPVNGLRPGLRTPYRVLIDGQPALMPAEAAIVTTGGAQTRFAFGSCMHKHYDQALLEQVRNRGNVALLLLGDNAVINKNADINLHRSDYLMRDRSPAWRSVTGSVGIYAAWDDHDYFNNDLGGIPPGYADADRRAVRDVFVQSWNNPAYGQDGEGIFFRTRIGPCDVIVLDTRYFRERDRAGGFLGPDQERWLFAQLVDSRGPFVLLTSGTMWSDYVSEGKDSWGVWNPEQRERIFRFIEEKRIGGVLLAAGDRHGARVFRIPRPSGGVFYEFEPASLGGLAGPPAKAPDPSNQLFGVAKTPAFGEFSFDAAPVDPVVTFRLIGADGAVLYELTLRRSELTPGK